jgi:chemotaxis protein methyltransferase CheR
MNTFGEYVDYLFSREGQSREVVFMMNEISTNKTDFFREAVHFDYLKGNILPALDQSYYRYHPLKVWSAGCSSGEEVYTLAMVLEEFRSLNPWFSYQITGTDISTKVLEAAVTAIYKMDKIVPVPPALREKYLLKGKDKNAGLVRVARELRQRVSFERLNFMDDHYRFSTQFDIVFCRNVLIYFDIETQEKIINKICRVIKDNGLLFLGHSESITRMNVPLKQLRPTVFNRI